MDSNMYKKYNLYKSLPEYILLSGAGRKRFWNLLHQNMPPNKALAAASRGKTDKKISELKKSGQLMSAIQKRNMPGYGQSSPPKKIQKTQHIDHVNKANPAKKQTQTSSEVEKQVKPKSKLISLVEIHNTKLLSDNEMKMIHDALLVEIAKGEAGKGPRFCGFFHKKGFILILCENHDSQDWLVKAVEKIKPWPEAELSTKIKNRTLIASTFLPGKEADTVEKALKLLQIQNKGLNTEEWKVLNENEFQGGRVVTFSIDRYSFEALKVSKFKALLGFRKIFFKIMNPQPQIVPQSNEVAESTLKEEPSAENEVNSAVTQEVNLNNGDLDNMNHQDQTKPAEQEDKILEENQKGEPIELSELGQSDQQLSEPCWDEEL